MHRCMIQQLMIIKNIKNPKNMEFGYVFLLKCNNKENEFVFEDGEVSEVKFVDFEKLEKMVEEKADGLLLHYEEYNKLFEYIRNNII